MSETLSTQWYGNTLLQWAIAVGAGLAVASIVIGLREVLRRRLTAFAARTDTRLDDHLAEVVGQTRAFFGLALGLLVAIGIVNLGDVEDVALRLVAVAALVQIGLWANTFVSRGIEEFAIRRNDPAVGGAAGILKIMALVGVWSIISLVILASLGVDVTAGVAGLGVGGVAVALAVQNVLGDLFASLSIVFDRPFVVGDFIRVGEEMGTVEQVGLKTTRIRSLTGELLILSNGELLGARIRNYKHLQERRIVFTIGITYETPRDKVIEVAPLLRDLVAARPLARVDRAHFKGFGASSLDFEVVYFVCDADYNRYMDIQHDINLAILEAFEVRGIEFAYPTQTLVVRGNASAPVIERASSP